MNAVETLKLIGRPNAYYPRLAKPLGGVNPAVLFSQLFYWQDKSTSELGVYKSVEELEEETGLTYREQVTARKKLVERGVLIETNKRLEHRLYFKIDIDKTNEVLAEFAKSLMSISPNAESAVREETNPQFGGEQNRSSLDQEITSKTTTEITTDIKNNKKSSLNLSVFAEQPSPEVWNDYLTHRKNIKAPLTQSALNTIAKEINKGIENGDSVDEMLSSAMASGWRAFKYQWLLNQRTSSQRTGGKPSIDFDNTDWMNGL